MKVSRLLAVALVSIACGAEPVDAQRQTTASPSPGQARGTGPARGTAVDANAAHFADFHARLKKYEEIRKEANKDYAKQKESSSPAEIKARQEALAARTIALRADAKPGDIFTAETRAAFRRLLAPELKGEDGRDAKEMLKDDAPAPGAVPLKVNAKYPEGQPLPTVPANLLLNMPRLPEGLEYRIIGKDLLLMDVDAQIVVDYIRNAIR